MFHVKHEGSTPLSEASARLRRFESLLLSRAVPAGLISRGDESRIWARHILDSLRATPFLSEPAEVVDLGSGAGLPGIPLAIARSHLRMTLADARRARIAFLELALEELEPPNAQLFAGRVEDLDRRFEVALARGFGSPANTWAAAERVLVPRGRLIYWAGRGFQPEEVPGLVSTTVAGDPHLERGGPIVIMARQ